MIETCANNSIQSLAASAIFALKQEVTSNINDLISRFKSQYKSTVQDHS
jgi:hypothetical protein